MKNIGAIAGVVFWALQIPAVAPVSAGTAQIRDFEYIELSDSNWEALGRYTQIKGDGDFQSYLRRGDAREGAARAGKVDRAQLKGLKSMLNDCEFYSLADRYDSRHKGRSGSTYRITMKTKARSKTVTFYSEDPAVPACLMKIVRTIGGMTGAPLLGPLDIQGSGSVE